MNKGIPTTYRGVRFRSRLEAKWAAFFDALEWPWVFEPHDLNFYIPDFVLRFPHAPIVVEVKPETEFAALTPHARRIRTAGWDRELIVVGSVLFGEPGGEPSIGMLGEVDEGVGTILGSGVIFQCIDCGVVSLRHGEQSFRCRVNGCYDGNAHVGSVDRANVDHLFAQASNRVQWRAPLKESVTT